MHDTLIHSLEAAMQRRLAALPEKIRLFTKEKADLPGSLLLTGPRGVGKTTFLLYHSRQREESILYFSADNPMLAADSLYETVQAIFMAGYNGVIIDEVHFARDWSLHIKALYDDYPGYLFWASDSSSIVLRQGTGDLSRRFVPIEMPLVSFRDFLFLETGIEAPIHNPFQENSNLPIKPDATILAAFRQYRQFGTRPFYKEGNFIERMEAILDKTLYADVPFFLPRINDNNLRLMKAIISTLSQSAIPRIQVRSLCSDWSISAEKLYQILNIMESVGLLRIIRLMNDKKARSVGAKLFFADPSLYSVLNGDRGTAREALCAALCNAAGWEIAASKDETKGDFVIHKHAAHPDKIHLEVGGKKKRMKNADFVIRDDLDYPTKNAIPLWLLGMSY